MRPSKGHLTMSLCLHIPTGLPFSLSQGCWIVFGCFVWLIGLVLVWLDGRVGVEDWEKQPRVVEPGRGGLLKQATL